ADPGISDGRPAGRPPPRRRGDRLGYPWRPRDPMDGPMLLMIDNYDSFTYNLVQYFGELGQDVKVVRNDALSVAQIAALKPDHIVISPGPCTPNEAGVSLEVLEKLAGSVPILGVCLGHQSLGQA